VREIVIIQLWFQICSRYYWEKRLSERSSRFFQDRGSERC